MFPSPILLLLLAGAAYAHQTRLSDGEIAALEANYAAMTNKAELAATAATQRASLKQMYVEDVMAASTDRKRAVIEAEADEWLETIQEAKRAVHRSMGIGNIEPRNDGLWQGDIILRQSEAEDIILHHGGELPAHRRAAAEKRRSKRATIFFDRYSANRWTTPIPYTFHYSIPDRATQDRIVKNLQRITNALPCLTFKYVSNPNPMSYFMNFRNPSAGKLTPNSCGGSAFIGMVPPDQLDGGKQPPVGNSINIECLMTFSDQCFIDTMITHEVCHSLGLGHEQTRGDRDAWVTIDFNNVIPNQANNYNIDRNDTYTVHGIQYHYDSVMQYKPTTFALDRSKNVMAAKVAPIAENTKKMGNNAPVCGCIDSDFLLLKKAYCMKPGCRDTDITCGWGPLSKNPRQSCSDATFARNCQKTCGTGACA